MDILQKDSKARCILEIELAKILNFCSTGSIIGSRLYLKPPPKANLKVKLKELYQKIFLN
jgi:hypothetical protein